MNELLQALLDNFSDGSTVTINQDLLIHTIESIYNDGYNTGVKETTERILNK